MRILISQIYHSVEGVAAAADYSRSLLSPTTKFYKCIESRRITRIGLETMWAPSLKYIEMQTAEAVAGLLAPV